jgi:hypothetical protein
LGQIAPVLADCFHSSVTGGLDAVVVVSVVSGMGYEIFTFSDGWKMVACGRWIFVVETRTGYGSLRIDECIALLSPVDEKLRFGRPTFREILSIRRLIRTNFNPQIQDFVAFFCWISCQEWALARVYSYDETALLKNRPPCQRLQQFLIDPSAYQHGRQSFLPLRSFFSCLSVTYIRPRGIR